jgi:hypothetical protein
MCIVRTQKAIAKNKEQKTDKVKVFKKHFKNGMVRFYILFGQDTQDARRS